FGITQSQVASSLLASLSGAQLLQPNFWLDPVSGVNYNVIAQVPQEVISSANAIANIPLSVSPQAATVQQAVSQDSYHSGNQPQLLGNLATVHHDWDPAVIAHYSVQRVLDVDCAVSRRDLGSVSADVQRAIDGLGKPPPGTHVVIRGQSAAMSESFKTLAE